MQEVEIHNNVLDIFSVWYSHGCFFVFLYYCIPINLVVIYKPAVSETRNSDDNSNSSWFCISVLLLYISAVTTTSYKNCVLGPIPQSICNFANENNIQHGKIFLISLDIFRSSWSYLMSEIITKLSTFRNIAFNTWIRWLTVYDLYWLDVGHMC